ncbi:hypothetical protein AK812_SmicGene8365 [Symbiodinium microadriaticum]|uniref:Uncharacterized protein n=1 Tax=Symbiodinium microadriaticum TaxID=2951 RepID=A0A1Q9EL32_SYMMI|nr:hypothetical protein AK812_SmicGene8365 [Symbiodinium microadriaticum]
MRDLRPAALLARAIRRRTQGDLAGEETYLTRCLHRAESLHAHARRDDREAARLAHFYLALQRCQLGRFQEADAHLSRLGLRARLADDLWTESCREAPGETFALRVFDDGLPAEVVRRARDALHPGASYWQDHRYHSEDVTFYSHAHLPGDETHIIDQLIEAMRPLLEKVAAEVASSVKVAEWWVHQRMPEQWHGHPLHYDTNEQLLRDSGGSHVEHPAISSVVYLCDDSPRFGPTVVTSQEYGDVAEAAFQGQAALVRPRLGRALARSPRPLFKARRRWFGLDWGELWRDRAFEDGRMVDY